MERGHPGRFGGKGAHAPLSSDEFSALMARLGPFESRPRLVVGVSGGSDSIALALLAADWAKNQGGESLALTVDHGLRPGSAVEAATVSGWMTAHGIRHATLTWEGEKPRADLQAAARAARYTLLEGFCRAEGVLHLLLAHHQDDQAETLLLRLGRGSGADGLAAMAALQPMRWGRLLRPLLDIPRGRLAATLTAMEQDWIEDPSNGNSVFARVRLRNLLPDLAAEGLTPRRLSATAARMGRVRSALDQATAEAAARWVVMHPAGFARCSAKAFSDLAEEIGLRLLARLILAVGGGVHVPRLERLERLYGELRSGLVGARTLGGCRMLNVAGDMLVCREPARVAPPVELIPGRCVMWDGRFLAEVAKDALPGLFLGAMGGRSSKIIAEAARHGTLMRLPGCVRPTLPSIINEDGVSAVPHLGYNLSLADATLRRLDMAPAFSLTNSGLRLV